MKRGPRIVADWKCIILEHDMQAMKPKDILKELKQRNIITGTTDKQLYNQIRNFA
ncbi:MAG: hypothetical protein GY861_13560 [bacterium]|nr:hypothetical protein [bacterium]